MSHVANAALPVAVALLVLTAIARGVIWSGIEGEEQRIAAKHLEALSTWCLIATATYAGATLAAGRVTVIGIAAAIVMAGAALLLRTEEPATGEVAAPEQPRREPEREMPAHRETPTSSLWDDTNEAKRTGLWAR